MQFQPQRLGRVGRPALPQLVDVDRLEDGLLGQQHRLLRAATDANAQHARRAPSGTHAGQLSDHPVGHAVARVQRCEPSLDVAAATLRRYEDRDAVSVDQFGMNDGRGVVPRVPALAQRVAHHRSPQRIDRIGIGTTHGFIGHPLQRNGRLPIAATKLHLHPDTQEHLHDTGVLA